MVTFASYGYGRLIDGTYGTRPRTTYRVTHCVYRFKILHTLKTECGMVERHLPVDICRFDFCPPDFCRFDFCRLRLLPVGRLPVWTFASWGLLPVEDFCQSATFACQRRFSRRLLPVGDICRSDICRSATFASQWLLLVGNFWWLVNPSNLSQILYCIKGRFCIA